MSCLSYEIKNLMYVILYTKTINNLFNIVPFFFGTQSKQDCRIRFNYIFTVISGSLQEKRELEAGNTNFPSDSTSSYDVIP